MTDLDTVTTVFPFLLYNPAFGGTFQFFFVLYRSGTTLTLVFTIVYSNCWY